MKKRGFNPLCRQTSKKGNFITTVYVTEWVRLVLSFIRCVVEESLLVDEIPFNSSC